MTRHRLFIGLTALLAATGCRGPVSYEQTSLGEQPEATSHAFSVDTGYVFGIGDVETAMEMPMYIPDERMSSAISQSYLKTMLDKLARVNITVHDPAIETLEIDVGLSSRLAFDGMVVLADVSVYRDDDLIFSEKCTFSTDAIDTPRLWHVDVLKGLDQRPKTMLVTGRTELSMYRGAHPDTFDIENAPDPGIENRATLLSNPVRIDFVQ